MHHDRTTTVPEFVFYLFRLTADKLARLVIGILGETTAKFDTAGPGNTNHITTPEFARYPNDTNGQQAIAVTQGVHGTFINTE